MCFNKKIVAGLAVAGLAVAGLAPNLIGAALPLLILAVCPLSMIVMMRFMAPSTNRTGADQSAQVSAELDSLRAEVAALRRNAAGALGENRSSTTP